MLNVLVVSLCKPVIHNLNFFGGNLNIINQWGELQKRGNQILKVQWREAKGGEHNFWLKFSRGGILGGNYVFFAQKMVHKSVPYDFAKTRIWEKSGSSGVT